MAQVVVAGSFNVDHVWRCEALPRTGETLAGTYRTGPGGKGFNQAVAAQRAGVETCFLCALGDDTGAQLARTLAHGDGIALRAASSNAPTGTAGIFVDVQARNSIVLGPGANADLSVDFVAAQTTAFDEARVVLAQLEVPVDAIVVALKLARARDAITVLNPAPADAKTTNALLMLADVLTPNETEFAALVKRHLHEAIDASTVAAMADEQLHMWCRKLLPHGTVVITLGSAGCFVSHPDSDRRGDAAASCRVAAESVHAIDTTGAGDAFNGALAASLAIARDAPFASHIRFAGRYAALSTEAEGAASAMPMRGDVERRFGG